MSNTFFQGQRNIFKGGLAPLRPPSYGLALYTLHVENDFSETRLLMEHRLRAQTAY